MKDHHLHTDEAQKAKDLAALDRQLRDKAVSLDDYLDENEWKQYLDSGNAGRNKDIPGDSYRPVYNASVRKTRRAQLLYKGVGVILLLCICGGAFFFLANNHQPAPSLAFDHTNTTAGPQRIQLPDGSAVVLQPKSELHYAGDYNVTARDIQLTGDAEFRI
ncbi:FecR family protein [Chitinophaga sedimenti]|uniref:FecR family protein n=1 Tax=Chitinophaga sedimenti TaxID=2033606 RepID=UPI0020069110|nr:FecR family protein [Chitinophaga sedimenti]MCK7557510.1 FecR family protein [Chitinophaga sedimenti]